jgi:hypothetical protein
MHFCKMFEINLYLKFDTVNVKASVVTYLQYANIHTIFVIGKDTRIVVMARPKSSLCMYTSMNVPINVLQLHIITVTI